MKSLVSILPEIKQNKKDKDPERMDLLMRTIKAVHSQAVNPLAMTPEELSKQRSEVEVFSKLITPSITTSVTPFFIDEIPCEWVRPEFPHRKDKLILYCHGGGYTSGGLGYARILATKLANHTGLEVIAFEYGLSPENPYPAAFNDALTVWDHLMKLGYGAKNVLLAGDSAGGNLALELTLSLKENDRFLPAGLILFSPWTDMTISSGSYETYKEKDPLLTREYVLSVRTAYAGSEADFTSPCFSPLYADLSGFPPCLIQAGSNEILRDDSEKLQKKLAKCGADARLEIYTGGWHVFQQMPIPRAAKAMDAVKTFLDDIL